MPMCGGVYFQGLTIEMEYDLEVWVRRMCSKQGTRR